MPIRSIALCSNKHATLERERLWLMLVCMGTHSAEDRYYKQVCLIAGYISIYKVFEICGAKIEAK